MTVVIGYLPNEYGEAALTLGLREAQTRGTDLLVLNTSKGDALADPKMVTEAGVEELRARLADAPVPVEVRQSIGSDVAGEIIAAATAAKAHLIVIGIRDRSAVGKMLMGSVALSVINHAPCPVLTVRPSAL
jgi:nucleotide-binding universal stress UspA family protein